MEGGTHQKQKAGKSSHSTSSHGDVAPGYFEQSGGGTHRDGPMSHDGVMSPYGREHDGMMHSQDINKMSPARSLRGESVDRLEGKIKSIKRVPYPDGEQMQLVLETDKEDITVLLGPVMFMNQSNVKIQVGDKVKVQAYSITVNGKRVFMASEISKNGNVLKLRDKYRKPAWQDNRMNQPYRHKH